MIVASPAQCIKPPRQAKPGRSIVGKFRESIALTDKDEMPFALTTKVKIALQGGDVLQTKLADQESRDSFGDFEISVRKRAEKPGRPKHECKAETVVVTAQPIDDFPIASVQVKIPRQLVRGRSGGKIGITLPLLIRQVAGGHIVRNSGLLRRVNGARKFKDIFLAKYLCGSRHFSNMFCEAREGVA